MKKIWLFFTLLPIIGLYNCAPSRFVEPLDKGEVSVGAHLGGPVIEFGAPIPMPITAIELGYGLDSNLTLHGAWHTTNFQIDAGVTYKLLNQNKYRPNVSVNPGFNFIYDFDDKAAKFWPTVDLNAYWNYGQRRSYFYLGFNNYFELSASKADNQTQTDYWIFNPQIGHIWKTKADKWEIITELKFLAPYKDNSYAFIPYTSLTGKNGANGFYLGVRYKLGKN